MSRFGICEGLDEMVPGSMVKKKRLDGLSDCCYEVNDFRLPMGTKLNNRGPCSWTANLPLIWRIQTRLFL